MSENRLTTAIINGTTYKLGEELNVNLASTTDPGIIKVGVKIGSSFKDDPNNCPLGIDKSGIGFVTIPTIKPSNNIGIANSYDAGIVRIQLNSGLKIDSSTGDLEINLANNCGISKSASNGNNPRYLKLDTATDYSLGGIKIGYVDNGSTNTYGIELDNDGKAFVYVPGYKKEVKHTLDNEIALTKDTIIVNMNNDRSNSNILITDSYLDLGDECELILNNISSLAISTSSIHGFNGITTETIKNNLYWEHGEKPKFEKFTDENGNTYPKHPEKIYKFKFTRIAPSSNSNQFGTYLVSYSSNYVNNQDNSNI